MKHPGALLTNRDSSGSFSPVKSQIVKARIHSSARGDKKLSVTRLERICPPRAEVVAGFAVSSSGESQMSPTNLENRGCHTRGMLQR